LQIALKPLCSNVLVIVWYKYNFIEEIPQVLYKHTLTWLVNNVNGFATTLTSAFNDALAPCYCSLI
jgi:hypothetical protein